MTSDDFDGATSAPPAESCEATRSNGPPAGWSSRSILVFVSISLALCVSHGVLIGVELGRFAMPYGMLPAVPGLVVRSVVESIGPTTSVCAALLGLLVWAHGVDEVAFRRDRNRSFVAAFVTATLGVIAIVPLTVICGHLAAHVVWGVPWARVVDSGAAFEAVDLGVGIRRLALEAALGGAIAWFAPPRLSRSTLSLPMKVAGVWFGSVFVLRPIVEAIL